ncbi:MAG: hypothetical protein ACYCUZ_03405 [Cuniculiplasma sp.]|jgi:hypothetical protein
MSVKSNKVTITVKGEAKNEKSKKEEIPLTLEGIQLCLQNAERLFVDSQKVSLPTKVALLELGLEEISKAWGLLLSFEKKNLDENPDLIWIFFEVMRIDINKYDEAIKNNENNIKKYFSDNTFKSFMTPFDKNSFSNHIAKIAFLSNLVNYIKMISRPLIIQSQDRETFVRDIIGKFVGEINIKDSDRTIEDILNIKEDQLLELVSFKEKGFYVDIEGGTLISPSSRTYYPYILEDLLILLIAMNKNEVTVISKILNMSKKT